MKRRRIVTVFALLLGLAALVVAVLGPRRVVLGGKQRVERAWLILTGGLVDAGGHRLRVERSGKGSPTVVMDTGLAQPRKTWGRVPDELAAFTQVVVYDRAGLGDSDPGPGPTPRTCKQIVDELHAMLTNAGIRGPYVLVGHSAGGLSMRLFASQYAGEVVGMVLVDSSHEDEYDRLAALLSPQAREDYLKHEGGGNYEQVDLLACAAEVRAAAPLKEMPIVVISSSGDTRSQEGGPGARVRHEMQANLARLAPHSSQVVAEGSGHFVQLDRPELVISVIKKVVEAARSAKP